MTATVRFSTITNTTGALLPKGSPALLVNSGQDYATQVVSRILTAQEAGGVGGTVYGVGTIRDNTNAFVLGTNGFLFAQFNGALIKTVSLELYRQSNIGAGGAVASLSKITGTAAGGPTVLKWVSQFVNGVSSLYLWDATTAVGTASTEANALSGDTIVATVTLGNS